MPVAHPAILVEDQHAATGDLTSLVVGLTTPGAGLTTPGAGLTTPGAGLTTPAVDLTTLVSDPISHLVDVSAPAPTVVAVQPVCAVSVV